MSFFDLSNVNWSALWLPPTLIAFFYGVVFWLEPPSRGLRRRGLQIALIVGLGHFAVEVLSQYPLDGRELRICLWHAILVLALMPILIWFGKPCLLGHWQDVKALIARIRRWRSRFRASGQQPSPIASIADAKLTETTIEAMPTSIPPSTTA